MYKLYLDDIRTPNSSEWVIVRSYGEFVDTITRLGMPTEISFDHDLADIHCSNSKESFSYHEKTGMDCAKWLCEYCMDNSLPLPKWNVHSANPVGADNIRHYLTNFEKII